MNITTVAKIESIEINLELGIELELDNLLIHEFNKGISRDIIYCV